MSGPRSIMARSTIAFLALSMFLLAGCSAAAIPGGGATGSATRLLARLTPLERQILTDRHVTVGEYDLAVQATIECLRTDGFDVSNPEPSLNGLISYSVSYAFGGSNPHKPPSQKKANHVDAMEQECVGKSAAVQAVYVLDHAASAQQVQQAFRSMIRCFKQNGVPLTGKETTSQVSTVMTKVTSRAREGKLSGTIVQHCESEYDAVSVQPLPGLSQALTALRNP